MKSNTKISFLVADDHTVVRQGLSMIIKELYTYATVFQVENFVSILEVLKQNPIDVLILDINFPDGNSITIIPEVKKIRPELKIMIFSAFDETVHALRFFNAGANGYLNKLSEEDEIKFAISTLVTQGKYISDVTKEKILNSYLLGKKINPIEHLSGREIEIARLLVKGYGNLEISNALDIQKTTVSTYKKRIFEKLQIDNLAELIELFTFFNEKV
ncbi:MAG TPA: response regulator transcription factor [Flavobacterium sp.]|uniref:response regulator transcription factor n=1 Tax=unclassified Flavobacterium TaxID=196869 RepID=UPI000E95138C|nr:MULTISPECIES: response regulator transcription factor [unclassified Flavobacterium]HBI01115.1 DNA-binding response regulator [Flavobacterium sp.]HRE78481.1 response regulator transcription factor [Flavobacterium sp.]